MLKVIHQKSSSRYDRVRTCYGAICATLTKEPECRDWHEKQHAISETPVSAYNEPTYSAINVWASRMNRQGGRGNMPRIKSALSYYNRIMASSSQPLWQAKTRVPRMAILEDRHTSRRLHDVLVKTERKYMRIAMNQLSVYKKNRIISS